MPRRSEKSENFVSGLAKFLTILFVFLVAREIATPKQKSSSSPIIGCRSNLQNLGTGVEMYAQDYGRYPTELSQITPDYFNILPQCPKAMSMTYAYRKTRAMEFQCTAHPEDESLECKTKLLRLTRLQYTNPADISDQERVTELVCHSGTPYTFVGYRDSYEIFCSGENHKSSSVLPDYPRYNGATGINLGSRP